MLRKFQGFSFPCAYHPVDNVTIEFTSVLLESVGKLTSFYSSIVYTYLFTFHNFLVFVERREKRASLPEESSGSSALVVVVVVIMWDA